MNLPDPVPLGVAGLVAIPRTEFPRAAAKPSIVLLDEAERLVYVAGRLLRALGDPISAPGFETVGRRLFARVAAAEGIAQFAEKVLATARDGTQHSALLIDPTPPLLGVALVCWSGSNREVQAERYGTYLDALIGIPRKLVEKGIPLSGFLQVDAYVRDDPDPRKPATPLDEVFKIDIEYSYVPWALMKGPEDTTGALPNVILFNAELCTEEENQLLERFNAPDN